MKVLNKSILFLIITLFSTSLLAGDTWERLHKWEDRPIYAFHENIAYTLDPFQIHIKRFSKNEIEVIYHSERLFIFQTEISSGRDLSVENYNKIVTALNQAIEKARSAKEPVVVFALRNSDFSPMNVAGDVTNYFSGLIRPVSELVTFYENTVDSLPKSIDMLSK